MTIECVATCPIDIRAVGIKDHEAATVGAHTLHLGDCLHVLRSLPANSVDSIVTDPPYGLSFMGKKWDYDVPGVDVWAECLRVLKPGGHLLAFAGTRTQHRMAVRIEDAGFEIRDMIAWVYGSGFPKSLDVSKAIDKAAGVEREVVGSREKHGLAGSQTFAQDAWTQANRGMIKLDITAPATEAARQWQGWGTALKPSLEPITMARKPFASTVASNVLTHGTGALNIDGCRVGTSDDDDIHTKNPSTLNRGSNSVYSGFKVDSLVEPYNTTKGRWPANLIHDGSEDVIAGFPDAKSSMGGGVGAGQPGEKHGGYSGGFRADFDSSENQYHDTGSAARFFYVAKASNDDRNEGLLGIAARQQDPTRKAGDPGGDNPRNRGAAVRQNSHPTVKPTDLMRYLLRLVTPPHGIALDPFMGSGSTGKAATLEDFRFIGIERDPAYFAIAQARIQAASSQSSLFAPPP